MIIRKKTIEEFAFSTEEIEALKTLASVNCDGCACIECPFHIGNEDNCVTDMSTQILNIQNIPYVKRERAEEVL